MGEAELIPPSVPPTPSPATRSRRKHPLWVQILVGLAMVPLLGYIGLTGKTIWGEWNSLSRDQVRVRESAVVGYLEINPDISYAASPDDWFHDEGNDSVLWAGWKNGKNHWFRFDRGDVDVRQLSMPMGRDVIRAVDFPVYEQDGGDRWERVPPEAPVIGFEHERGSTAYPIRVLEKVQVVNEQVGDRPVLLVLTPGVMTVTIYEATLDGRRITLGHGGYFRGYRPVLYDRGTQSLWSEGKDGMVAVAGPRKGTTLKRIASPAVVAWSDWREKHPEGRLLVGADRSKGLPAD